MKGGVDDNEGFKLEEKMNSVELIEEIGYLTVQCCDRRAVHFKHLCTARVVSVLVGEEFVHVF